MTQSALDVLKHTFGYDSFRGNQAAVIDTVCQGEDCVVIMPTGGGKSLCYQIPALLRPGMGIVVSPLIALMQDQVTALQQLGVAAGYLNSSLSQQQKSDLFHCVNRGELDLLYIAPERLLQPATLEWLSQQPISVIAIDEAHCVSQWGHDFRSDYLALGQLGEVFPSVPRIALTATATEGTRKEITENLKLTNSREFVSSFDRSNIHYSVQPRRNGKRQLLNFLSGRREQTGVVYCLSRKKVEETARWLSEQGFNALPYHAGLDQSVRETHLNRFLREDSIVMVATIAFGMGIDKPNVRYVCHLDLPKSMEAYYQETGRAGRDGEPSDAWMVYGLNDVVQLQQMVQQSDAPEERKHFERNKLNALLGWCEETRCRRQSLLAYFGETLEQPCGNCDTCTTPPPTWDATVPAQKILSCIYRTGQRFGTGYIIDVLRGKDLERIRQLGHDKLSTYGLGKEMSETRWRSILRQLIVRGYIVVDSERFGALSLTENARPLLRSEQALHLRQDLEEKTQAVKQERSFGTVSEKDRELWQKLRECRAELASEHGIPAYQVFHDATLMEMMQYKPQDTTAMLAISGVGEKKFERFGAAFLSLIKAHTTNA